MCLQRDSMQADFLDLTMSITSHILPGMPVDVPYMFRDMFLDMFLYPFHIQKYIKFDPNLPANQPCLVSGYQYTALLAPDAL